MIFEFTYDIGETEFLVRSTVTGEEMDDGAIVRSVESLEIYLMLDKIPYRLAPTGVKAIENRKGFSAVFWQEFKDYVKHYNAMEKEDAGARSLQ